MRWPADQFSYIGHDMDGDMGMILKGEYNNAVRHYEKDMYACRGHRLEMKLERNPFNRV